MSLSSNDIVLFLFNLGIMLLFARGFGELMRYFKQPIVIGEIFAGLVLGPSILGYVFPDYFNNLFSSENNFSLILEGITSISVVLLMLVSGLEINLGGLVRNMKSTFYVSLFSLLIPFSFGFIFGFYNSDWGNVNIENGRIIFALFLGVALSITALPIVAKTLMDLNLFKTRMGNIIISSAMINDLIGWIGFSIVVGLIGIRLHEISLSTLLFVILFFYLFVLVVGRKLIHYVIPIVQEKLSYPGGIINFILILGFLSAAFTEYIGIHAIFGSFLIGIAIGDSAFLKENVKEIIQQFINNIFAPLLFISIGLKVNIWTNLDLSLVFPILILAIAGKLIGGVIGSRVSGFGYNESMIIAHGMNSRGIMEIVLGLVALKNGIIGENFFVVLVIVAIVTSLMSGPFMKYYFKKIELKTKFCNLLRRENIIFRKSGSKESIYSELIELITVNNNMKKDLLLSELLAQEKNTNYGLTNFIAIPHIKMKIDFPLVAMAIVEEGVDVLTVEGEKSGIVILLISPENDPELHLRLLSEIVKVFPSKEHSMEIIKNGKAEEIIKIIREIK